MEHRYSLKSILRLALIITVMSAMCFLQSCKGSESGSAAPPPVVSPSEDAEETRSEQTPMTSDTPSSPSPTETETAPPETETVTPEESPSPVVSETPEASETPEVSETPETWTTPYSKKSSSAPRIPDDPEGGAAIGGGIGMPERVYPQPDKIAYITIDDGPTREVTPQILDILKEHGIRATFFVLPHSDADDLYIRILDEGHVLGNHSYSHKYKPLYAEDTTYFLEDLLAMHDFIYNMLGYTPTLYRFPGGAMGRNKATIAARVEILEEHGYAYFDWNSSTGDSDSTGEGKGTQTLIDNVLNKTNDRKQLVVLMHDSLGKQTTVEALPYIIDGLRMQGYTFDTLDNYG